MRFRMQRINIVMVLLLAICYVAVSGLEKQKEKDSINQHGEKKRSIKLGNMLDDAEKKRGIFNKHGSHKLKNAESSHHHRPADTHVNHLRKYNRLHMKGHHQPDQVVKESGNDLENRNKLQRGHFQAPGLKKRIFNTVKKAENKIHEMIEHQKSKKNKKGKHQKAKKGTKKARASHKKNKQSLPK